MFDVNKFLSDNIHFFLLGLYAIFVVLAIVWDRSEQAEEPPIKSTSPPSTILIEMKTIEGGKKVSEESDKLEHSIEPKEPKSTQNGDIVRQGTEELVIR